MKKTLFAVFVILFSCSQPGENSSSDSGVNRVAEEKEVSFYHSIVNKNDYSRLQKKITEKDVVELSISQLRLLRNYYFARKGYRFETEDLKRYFSKYEWYKAEYSLSEIELNDVEKENIDLIISVENIKKSNKDENNYHFNSDYKVYGLTLPQNISNLITILSDDCTVVLPDPEELSPVGQIWQWKGKISNTRFYAISDDYSQIENRDADVRIIGIQSLDASVVDTVFDFSLNKTTAAEVKKIFKKNDHFQIHRLPNSEFIVIKYKEYWYHFEFDDQKKLKHVRQLSFQIHPSLSP